jgi:adenosylcobinamide-phosphate synthase
MSLAARGLATAGREVQSALEADDLPGARRLLAWHLVSRDTSALSDHLVAAAAVESVAENTSDGVIAPLTWFAVGGLPAALAYKFVNTADAMLGYRDAEREWLGKTAARVDDLLNLVPARLAAVLMMVFGGRVGGIRVWWQDCRETASPNAGHSMAAAAGVLGIELEKVGAYILGAGQRLPAAGDIGRAVRLMWATTAGGTVLVAATAVIRGVLA